MGFVSAKRLAEQEKRYCRKKRVKREPRAIELCLHMLTLYGIFAWRQPNNGRYSRHLDSFTFDGLRGVADILGCLPDGRFLAVEIKAAAPYMSEEQLANPEASLSPEQAEFKANILKAGGLALVVRDAEELAKALDTAGYSMAARYAAGLAACLN